MKYIVVLFKNKKKKKILKKFKNKIWANKFYQKMLKKSNETLFEVTVENGKPCSYEIALIEVDGSQDFPLYVKDDLGRNIKIKMDDNNLIINEISEFRKEEKIFDVQKHKKITISHFIKSYLNEDDIKMISALNHKIVLQKNNVINVFSMKSESESTRFVKFLTKFLHEKRRGDCLVVGDNSSSQRKFLIKYLSDNGFDKKILYRRFTTHPRRG